MKAEGIQKADKAHASAPTKNPTARLALFDFDGTITTRDTLIEFVHFYRGRQRYLLGMIMLAPYLAVYALKLIPNWKAKQFFLSQYFKGEKISDFDARCLEFTNKVLPLLIRPEAMKAIEAYRRENATVVVVSASAENWIKPWCDQNGILCLGTRLEVAQGTVTGKINGRNCYGDEKVCRIKENFDLSDYSEVIAYGDSSGDKEMLALAHRKYYKPFRGND
jgi:HAD superfamily hydrolase (TIGR01490 family)